MSSKKRRFLNLNILNPQTSQPPVYMRVLHWLLSSGRYLVVIVELVVILGFVTRFKLDQDLSDLDDKIKQQIPYLQSLKQDEVTIRQTQFQLASIKQIKVSNPDYATALLRISQLTPQSVKFNSINFDATKESPKVIFRIDATALSSPDMNAFVNALKNDGQFDTVNLADVAIEKGQLIFTLSGSLKSSTKATSSS